MTDCCASAINRNDAYPQAFYFVTCDCGKTWAIRHTITTQLVDCSAVSDGAPCT